MQDLMVFFSNHPFLISFAIIVLILLIIVEFSRKRFSKISVDTFQLTQLMNRENAAVIDIRTKEQYRQGHILDALSMTANDLMDSKRLDKFKKRPIVIICQNGVESRKIAAKLLNQGYNAYALSSGMQAWINAELPLIKE